MASDVNQMCGCVERWREGGRQGGREAGRERVAVRIMCVWQETMFPLHGTKLIPMIKLTKLHMAGDTHQNGFRVMM